SSEALRNEAGPAGRGHSPDEVARAMLYARRQPASPDCRIGGSRARRQGPRNRAGARAADGTARREGAGSPGHRERPTPAGLSAPALRGGPQPALGRRRCPEILAAPTAGLDGVEGGLQSAILRRLLDAGRLGASVRATDPPGGYAATRSGQTARG